MKREQVEQMWKELEGISDGDLKSILLHVKMGTSKEIYDWISSRIKPIHIRSSWADIKMEKKTREFIESFNVEAKKCFYTAWTFAVTCEEIDYVEGYYYNGLPILHAWNKHGEDHFDVTEDVILKTRKPAKHFSIFSLTGRELIRYSIGLKRIGSFLRTHYLNHLR